MKKFNMQACLRTSRKTTLCAFLLLVALQLAACSAFRFGYDHGETVAYWWLNAYIDIEPEQTALVRRELAGWLAWHRANQLPQHIVLLRQAQRRVDGVLTPADALADLEQMRRSLDPMLERALAPMAEFALTLHPHQLEQLARKFSSKNDEYRQKFLRGDAAQRQQARYKSVREHVEYWFGSLSRAQQAQLRAAIDAHPVNAQALLERRIVQQQAMLTLLHVIVAERPAPVRIMAQIRTLAHSAIDGPPDARLRAQYDADLHANAALLADIVALMTPAQRAHAHRRLQDLIDDCTALHAAAGPRVAALASGMIE